jgi:hypothetical protein
VILQVAIDESGYGQTGADEAFLFAGYVAPVRQWETFIDKWALRHFVAKGVLPIQAECRDVCSGSLILNLTPYKRDFITPINGRRRASIVPLARITRLSD